MEYKIITPITKEPVTLNEVQIHLRLNADEVAAEKDMLENLIIAAREYCEGYIRRALAAQTIEAYPDRFPCGDRFELPRPPLQSVTSVKYKDSGGTEITMPAADYVIDTGSNVGAVVLAYGVNWPNFTPYPVTPIKVRYVAGYDEANPIPRSIKQAMLLLVGHWYQNREAVLTGTISKETEFAVNTLLSQHRAGWF